MRLSAISLLLGAGLLLAVSAPFVPALAQETLKTAPSAEEMDSGMAMPPGSGSMKAVKVPACQFVGQTVTADLSTTSGPGALIDPHWNVTGPAQPQGTPNVGGPSHATLWSALPANWIQPFATATSDQYGTAWSNAAVGDYTYSIRFHLPCDPRNYQSITLSGIIAADNSFRAYLNTSLVDFAHCPPPVGSNCWSTAGITINPVTNGFVQGANWIKVVVHNDGGYTGMAAKLTLTLVCGKECCVTLPVRGRDPIN